MPPSFCVSGGRPLKGTIRPAGNKNAALPILAATLLAEGPCRIENVPHIRDVETMLELLARSEEHTSELQSLAYLVCRLLLEKKKKIILSPTTTVLLNPNLTTH